MFIKIEGLDKEPVLVNTETIRVIVEYKTPETTFCRIHFDTEDAHFDTPNTLMMLESLLNANSVEKQIARLKYENTMERIRQSTQDAITEAMRRDTDPERTEQCPKYRNVGMSVEDRMCDGICDGCDMDPTMCYNQGYCEYDKEEIKDE